MNQAVIVKLLCASSLLSISKSYNVICPELKCEEEKNGGELGEGACFKMKTEVASDPILARECYDASTSGKSETAKLCPFDLDSGEYAWIDEKIQNTENTETSPFKNKMIDAYCKEVSALSQDLLPGRACGEGYNCKSSNCKESVCVGRAKNENCVDDSDCDAGLYCRMQSNWPYITTCTEVKNEFEFCKNDYECQNHQFCWYPDEQNKENDLKTCMSIYSQDDGTRFGWYSLNTDTPSLDDFKQNGKYCVSGLAYPYSANGARCTSFKEMKFNGEVIPEPFKCDPTNQDLSCSLYFNIYDDDEDLAYTVADRSYVSNQCKCALDGSTDEFGNTENNGYCSSIIGTEIHAAQAYLAHAIMMQASGCHTRDRFNMRAQKDEACGIGTSQDHFRFAIDKMFNITYWPYIQNDEKYMCIRRFFSDSYDSLILQKAISLGAAAATFTILTVLSI